MKLLDRTQLTIGITPFRWRLSIWSMSGCNDIRVCVGPFFIILAWPYSDAGYKRALQ